MDKSLDILCDSIKRIIGQMKPQHHALSFVLLIGKDEQGKDALMRKSEFDSVEIKADKSASIY